MNLKKILYIIIEFIAPTCIRGGHRQCGDMVTNDNGNKYCWHKDCMKANMEDVCPSKDVEIDINGRKK